MTCSPFNRLLAMSLVLFLAFPAIWANENEQIARQGSVIGPEGQPAVGFTVVFRDPRSGAEVASGPTDGSGAYVVLLPRNRPVVVDRVITPEGAEYDVLNSPALSKDTEGEMINVRLVLVRTGRVMHPLGQPATVGKGSPRSKKKKGTIIGVVLGGSAAAALLSGGSDNQASPSSPGQ